MGGRKTPRSGEQVRTAQYLSRDQIEVCFGLCCAAPQPEVDSIGVSQVPPADGGFERLSAPSQMASGPSGQLSWSQGAGVLVEPWASASTTPQLHRRHRQQSSTASPSSTTLDYEPRGNILNRLDAKVLSDQNGLKVPLGVAVAPQAYWSMLADPLAFGGGHQADRHIGPTKGGFGTTTPQPHRRFHSGPRNTSGIPVGPIMPKDCWGVTLLEASDLQIRAQRPVSGIVGSAHGPNSFLFNASPWYSAVSIGLRVGNSDSVYREEPSTWPEIDLAFGPHRAVTGDDPQSLGLLLETLSVACEDRHVLCLPYDQGLCQCRMLCAQHSLRQSCASALANPTKGGWARAPPSGSGRGHLLAQPRPEWTIDSRCHDARPGTPKRTA